MSPVLEIAVFAVNDPSQFPPIQRRAHEALATQPGHLTGVRLRGLSDETFADLIAWESFEAAQRAASVVQQDARFSELMASIAQLRLYAHYRLTTDLVSLLDALRGAPVVEVAAYEVHDLATLTSVHGQVHDALRTRPGYCAGAPAAQIEHPSQRADLVGWMSAADHERAGQTLQARPELAPFFASVGPMHVFSLYSYQAKT